MKNKTTNIKNRKSLKGKYGKVGAPPKSFSLPNTPFTYAQAFARNSKSCELTVRNKVNDMLESGELIALKTRKQKGGTVGRPKDVFIKKENFNKDEHERLDAPVKTSKPRNKKITGTAVVVTPTVTPTTVPPVVTSVAAVSVPTPEPEATPVAATLPIAEIVAETVASESVVG